MVLYGIPKLFADLIRNPVYIYIYIYILIARKTYRFRETVGMFIILKI